jgi:hypothetical protein
MQGARSGATEKMSKANFGEDLPLGYDEATYQVDRRGCEHRATPQMTTAVVFK